MNFQDRGRDKSKIREMEGIDTKTATTIESGSKVSGFDGVEMNVKQSKVRKQYRDVYVAFERSRERISISFSRFYRVTLKS